MILSPDGNGRGSSRSSEPSGKPLATNAFVGVDQGLLAEVEMTRLQKSKQPEPRFQLLMPCKIREKMLTHGFPELRRHWERFEKLGVSLEALSSQDLSKESLRAIAPYFGSKVLASTCSAGIALALVNSIGRSLPATVGGITSQLLLGLVALNGVFVGSIAVTSFQRRFYYAQEQLMAKYVAFMLSWTNFRQWHLESSSAKVVAKRLSEYGLSSRWDDPNYKIMYSKDSVGRIKVEHSAPEEKIHLILKEFLGSYNSSSRRHIPGKYTPQIRGGKSGVADFIRKHSENIELSRTKNLPLSSGIALLCQLRENLLSPGTSGDRYLGAQVERLNKKQLTKGIVQAAIWDRDPWIDLTHQEEFYSSASLRGVKLLGRGVKGRLGTFGYLMNKSISALDFSTDRGRQVRARIAAVVVRTYSDCQFAALFVDGVEGSYSVKPEIIKNAIEGYAKAVGFKAVIFNKNVHNQVPKRFVRHLSRVGLKEELVDIEFFDSGAREYLDAFGSPMEPFEYQYPKGSVIGYVVRFDRSLEQRRIPVGAMHRVSSFVRKNCLWFFCGESILLGAASLATYYPSALPSYVLLMVVALYAQIWHQRKGTRNRG